jgi:hypothetical protein
MKGKPLSRQDLLMIKTLNPLFAPFRLSDGVFAFSAVIFAIGQALDFAFLAGFLAPEKRVLSLIVPNALIMPFTSPYFG